MQAAKKPGLAKRSHGESKRSGLQPTGNLPPATKYPAHAGTRKPASSGQRPNPMAVTSPKGNRIWSTHDTRTKGSHRPPDIPCDRSGFRKARIGLRHGNRHLHDLAESIDMNVGGLLAEASSPPVKQASVGGPIVVRRRESRLQGEGGQLDGISTQINRMLTGMKFP